MSSGEGELSRDALVLCRRVDGSNLSSFGIGAQPSLFRVGTCTNLRIYRIGQQSLLLERDRGRLKGEYRLPLFALKKKNPLCDKRKSELIKPSMATKTR